MKKILTLVAVLAAFSSVSFSQTEKGKIFVSGSSNLNFTSRQEQVTEDDGTEKELSITHFNIKPSLGYFFANNFAVAISFNYELNKEGDYKYREALVGPMLRYYILESNIKPYVQGGLMFGANKIRYNAAGECKENVFRWDLGAGVAFFLNDYVSIDLGLGYSSVSKESKYDDDEFEVFNESRDINAIAFTGGLTIVF
ncbi:porin family protein [Marinilabiliaceae bacterium JC017]|nr:porin family protein [Marinilabiliaceae bacterium JC017]